MIKTKWGNKWGLLPLSRVEQGVKRGDRCENCNKTFVRDDKAELIARTLETNRIVGCNRCIGWIK